MHLALLKYKAVTRRGLYGGCGGGVVIVVVVVVMVVVMMMMMMGTVNFGFKTKKESGCIHPPYLSAAW